MKATLKFWIGAILIAAIFVVNDMINDRQLSTAIDERISAQNKLEKEQHENFMCVYTRDSLFKENVNLSKYKTLTKAMIHRDEAVIDLKKVGEAVYMKSDSTRGIIEDVIIGGSKYNYYVKYRILFSDNSCAEVIPELVY